MPDEVRLANTRIPPYAPVQARGIPTPKNTFASKTNSKIQ